jgi:hypothetical protein
VGSCVQDSSDVSYDLTAVMFQVEVFWVVTPCSVHGPLERWYPATKLHSVTTQKTSTSIHLA